MKKNYVLPGLWEKKQILIPLISLYKNNPTFFYDDISLNAVFGNFTHFIWDGGRPSSRLENFAYQEDIEIIQDIYNNILNISMRLVCTNPFIQKQDYKDKFCNLVLKICENTKNSIIINSQKLEEYIKLEYPSYNFISSTTKCLESDQDIINELQKNYLFVCLPYKKNFDFNFLQNIPDSLKSKIELLVNEKCYINCPKRKQHYIEISKTNYLYDFTYANNFQCILTSQNQLQNAVIPYNQLEKYINLSINNFKLEGRTFFDNYVLLYDIINYCIKSEWRLFILRYMTNWMENFDLYKYKLENYKIK